MKWDDADEIAQDLLKKLRPACERIEIAGGLRRMKPEPHDIELVAVPKIVLQNNMFGEPIGSVNQLDYVPSVLGHKLEMLKGGQRYKQFKVLGYAETINLDLFIVLPPAQWGVIYTIRTGPSDFSHWIVTPRSRGGALPDGHAVRNGQVLRGSEVIPMPEEQDFLDLLGLGWIEPKDRKAEWNRNWVF